MTVDRKLSPHHRDDEADGLDPGTRDYMYRHYVRQLPNLDRNNPKLLVVFSGGNAVGKSTLAHRIGERFGGLVLENDAIKLQLMGLFPDADRDRRNRLTWQYTMDLYRRLDSLTSNGLVIRDGVIDWYYDRILPIFLDRGYKLFIVGYDISQRKSRELITARGDKPTVTVERMHALIEDHDIHIRRFRDVYTPDIVLDDETIFDHDRVLQALEHTLKELRSA